MSYKDRMGRRKAQRKLKKKAMNEGGDMGVIICDECRAIGTGFHPVARLAKNINRNTTYYLCDDCYNKEIKAREDGDMGVDIKLKKAIARIEKSMAVHKDRTYDIKELFINKKDREIFGTRFAMACGYKVIEKDGIKNHILVRSGSDVGTQHIELLNDPYNQPPASSEGGTSNEITIIDKAMALNNWKALPQNKRLDNNEWLKQYNAKHSELNDIVWVANYLRQPHVDDPPTPDAMVYKDDVERLIEKLRDFECHISCGSDNCKGCEFKEEAPYRGGCNLNHLKQALYEFQEKLQDKPRTINYGSIEVRG